MVLERGPGAVVVEGTRSEGLCAILVEGRSFEKGDVWTVAVEERCSEEGGCMSCWGTRPDDLGRARSS